jgi:hypothetical protein
MKIGFDVAQCARELFIGRDNALRGFSLLENLLRLFLIVPKVGG